MSDDDDFSLQLDRAATLAIIAGRDAAERANEIAERGERARTYFTACANLLRLYISPNNLSDGKPLYPLSPVVAMQLANFCDYFSVGIIPDPVKHCARRGHLLGPDERRDVRQAVVYVLAAKRGLINDRYPVNTIAKEYGTDRKSVQGWITKYRQEIPEENSANPELIESRMRQAAGRYRKSGRNWAAIRNRTSP